LLPEYYNRKPLFYMTIIIFFGLLLGWRAGRHQCSSSVPASTLPDL